jgi:hypothetical protein
MFAQRSNGRLTVLSAVSLMLDGTMAERWPRLVQPVAKTKSSARRRRPKAGALDYRLEIDAFTPQTLPMARLAEYLSDLAVLMGEREHVHFRNLEDGSAVLVSSVDWEALPKVRTRLNAVKRRQAPADVLRVADAMNRRLAEDNASATLIDPKGTRVLRFVGRDRGAEPDYVFTQLEELYGVVIVVGGTSDPLPVHLQDEDVVHLCEAPRSLAREIAAHIFGPPLLVSGIARRSRGADGEWKTRSFRIQEFRPLDDRPLVEVVRQLREVDAEWTSRRDPLGELEKLRKGH